MTTMVQNLDEVRCDFDDCDASMIFRVVLAVVDQMGADADTDLSILESMDLPLEDAVEALLPRGIEAARVWLDGQRLIVAFDVSSTEGIVDQAPLGDASELVASFFNVDVSVDPPRIRLSTSLG